VTRRNRPWGRRVGPPPSPVPLRADATLVPASPVEGSTDHLLRSLLELSRDLTVSMDLFDTTDLLLFNLMGQVGASRSALWLTSERDGALAVVRCHGFNRRLVNGAISSCRDDLLERIAERSTVPRVWMQVSELPEDSFMLIHQANIAVLAPLRTHGELIGWIALGTRVNRSPYGPAELDVLETALGMIAMALENTRLFNRVRETNRGLVAANEHLKELDRLKSEFLNNVNHELRTPLAVVHGAIEAVLESPALDPSVRPLLESARRSSGNLAAIIENLLLWSECARDHLPIAMGSGDVRDALETVYRSRLPGITEDLRELQLEISDELGHAWFDRARLEQILNELLDNAVKFTPRGTCLRIRGCEEPGDDDEMCTRIDVEDNGPGIPPDRLPSLFRSFEQVDGSTTRHVGGLGIGLSFAYHLAERMGGTLEVTSRVGFGTMFTLRLRADTGERRGRRRAA
jgi:signal transduction histidine kinase